MQMVSVESSNLQAVGYDKSTKTLRVLFLEGSTYEYYALPASLYKEMLEADSVGSFFKENVVGQFQFQKLTSTKESNQMGKNKQQQANEARAKAAAPNAAQPAAEQPKPAVQPAPAPAVQAPATAQPTKQEQTIAKLRDGWTAKGVDLSKLTITDDGKFKLAVVGEGWPTVQVGPTGGITVKELRSYTSAFDAAVNGLELFTKQKARDQKKVTTPAPQPAPATAALPSPKESTATRKKKQSDAVEAKLEAASA